MFREASSKRSRSGLIGQYVVYFKMLTQKSMEYINKSTWTTWIIHFDHGAAMDLKGASVKATRTRQALYKCKAVIK